MRACMRCPCAKEIDHVTHWLVRQEDDTGGIGLQQWAGSVRIAEGRTRATRVGPSRTPLASPWRSDGTPAPSSSWDRLGGRVNLDFHFGRPGSAPFYSKRPSAWAGCVRGPFVRLPNRPIASCRAGGPGSHPGRESRPELRDRRQQDGQTRWGHDRPGHRGCPPTVPGNRPSPPAA